jgi:hypothetical protein
MVNEVREIFGSGQHIIKPRAESARIMSQIVFGLGFGGGGTK